MVSEWTTSHGLDVHLDLDGSGYRPPGRHRGGPPHGHPGRPPRRRRRPPLDPGAGPRPGRRPRHRHRGLRAAGGRGLADRPAGLGHGRGVDRRGCRRGRGRRRRTVADAARADPQPAAGQPRRLELPPPGVVGGRTPGAADRARQRLRLRRRPRPGRRAGGRGRLPGPRPRGARRPRAAGRLRRVRAGPLAPRGHLPRARHHDGRHGEPVHDGLPRPDRPGRADRALPRRRRRRRRPRPPGRPGRARRRCGLRDAGPPVPDGHHPVAAAGAPRSPSGPAPSTGTSSRTTTTASSATTASPSARSRPSTPTAWSTSARRARAWRPVCAWAGWCCRSRSSPPSRWRRSWPTARTAWSSSWPSRS